MTAKLPKAETLEKPGNAFVENVFYMQTVGNDLLERYENRDLRINEWVARGESKDTQLAKARLHDEPFCQHCGKHGMCIMDKTLLNRERNGNFDDSELVLFTLHCSHCRPWLITVTKSAKGLRNDIERVRTAPIQIQKASEEAIRQQWWGVMVEVRTMLGTGLY